MKRISAVAVLIVTLIMGVLPTHTYAAGGTLWPRVRLSASASSAAADSSATITITAQFYAYGCLQNGVLAYSVETPDGCEPGDSSGGEVKFGKACPYGETITVRVGIAGEGVTPSKTDICGGATGSDTFTVKSSSAGTKTISAIVGWSYDSNTRTEGSVSLNFTAPPAAPAPKPKATTAAPAQAAAPTTTVPAPPETPTLATVKAGSEEIAAGQKVSIEQSKPLVLSGKSVPNGKVTVYVFSDPKQFTTAADKDGNWSLEVKDLPTGQHHAEVEVTDPATNQTSPRSRILEFSVVSAAQPKTTATLADSPSRRGLWVGLVLLIVAVGAAGFFFWKRKLHNKRSTPSSDVHPPSGQDNAMQPPANSSTPG